VASSPATLEATANGDGGSRAAAGHVWRRQPGPAELDQRRHRSRRRAVDIGLGVGVPVVLLLLWEWAAGTERIDARLFPPPSTIWDTAVDLHRSGELWSDVLVSTRRVLYGFVLGSGVGIAVGLLTGMSRLLRAALDPLLAALYTVPKLALLPLFLLIFGVGETPKIVLIASTVFFFMWISTGSAIAMVAPEHLEVARSVGAGRWRTFVHVYLPASLPQVFVGLRVAAGVSVLVMVGVEFVQSTDGIGFLIWHSWSLFIASRMYVGIVVVALMGYLFIQVVGFLGRRLTPWASVDRGAVDAAPRY